MKITIQSDRGNLQDVSYDLSGKDLNDVSIQSEFISAVKDALYDLQVRDEQPDSHELPSFAPPDDN